METFLYHFWLWDSVDASETNKISNFSPTYKRFDIVLAKEKLEQRMGLEKRESLILFSWMLMDNLEQITMIESQFNSL